ncbi:SDR family oxidoreductase [Pararhizobium sp.]|uniref:SDR family oxidoreductase n=1 Tax=Pararhizobium sp. TaxID=1977563 RepID=UPI00271CA4F9|nr:SDR family oxidoreductase [Pararhizobium sp.]MDO9417287.1 SDR family oxidoreductase [Pararhizobium sp.]
MTDKILVLGAGGTIGAKVVAALVAKGENVKAATRKASPVAGAEAVAFDYGDRATYAAALDGVDRIFVIAPGGYLDPVGLLTPVITAAAERKIKVVLMTVLGVDADDSIPYRQVELFLEKAGTPFVIVRPNWFSDNFHSYWLDGVRHGTIAVPAGDGKTSFIDARDIAASIAGALTTNAFDGQAINLTGPEALGYGQAADIISTVTGKTVAYTPVEDAAFIGMLTGAGVPEAYASFLASIFYPVRQGWTAVISDGVEKLTGAPPRSLAAYAKDNVAALKA